MSLAQRNTTYQNYVEEVARDFLNNYFEEWQESEKEWGAKSKEPSFYQWCDYAGQLHEHIDSEAIGWSLADCTWIIENTENEETDSGLWGGKDFRGIASAKAFFSLKNDVWFEIARILKEEKELSNEVVD